MGGHTKCRNCGLRLARRQGLCITCFRELEPEVVRADAEARRAALTVHVCANPVCGKEFMAVRSGRMYCSDACNAVMKRGRETTKERERKRERTPKRQAYHAQRDKRINHEGPRDDISLEELAERDLWTCHRCGGVVTRNNWSRDHLLPLSHDGPHTWDNVMLMHARCNSSKGNRVPLLDDLL